MPQGAAVRFDSGAGLDISAQFLADSLALERRYLDAVRALPRERLPADAQLTYDLFKRERELAVESFTYPAELLPVNPFRSVPLEFARTGAGTGPYAILSGKDLENWQLRVEDYVRWTDEAIANLRDGLRRGYAEPRVLIEEMLPVLGALAEDTPSSVFYDPLRSLPGTLAEPERKRLSEGINPGVKSKILPAYDRLRDFLRDEYLPRARQSVGLSALPLGESWYAFLVRRETGSRLKPAELHAIGVAETERLRGRMQALLAEAGFAGTAQAFYEAMRREPRTAFKSAEELQNFYDQLKVQAASAIPMLFQGLPQGDFAIRRLDPFREAISPALSYQRAANRNSAAILYVNTAGLEAQPIVPTIPCSCARRSRGTTSKSRFRRSAPIYRDSAVRAATPASSKAGESMPSLWASSWDCTATPNRSSQRSPINRNAPPAWSSIPASMRSAGREIRRSATCARSCRSTRRAFAMRSTGRSHCPARRWRAPWADECSKACASAPNRVWARASMCAPFIRNS